MPKPEMQVDTANWSGDGDLTQKLLDVLRRIDAIGFVRVADAPASRADTSYNLLANDIHVWFRGIRRLTIGRWLGFVPIPGVAVGAEMTLAGLEARLAADPDIGRPDYADEEMLQYLRTERIVQEYQRQGYKILELVRIYALKGET